jgi:hypothetical protein
MGSLRLTAAPTRSPWAAAGVDPHTNKMTPAATRRSRRDARVLMDAALVVRVEGALVWLGAGVRGLMSRYA